MHEHHAAPTGPRMRKRVLGALGAAAIAVPLIAAPSAAFAAPYAPPTGIDAIKSGTYLPDYLQEFTGQVNDEAVFGHVKHLAVDIGPRVAGTSAEVEANAYVKRQLESYGFTTETETFPVSVSTYANATPDRDLPTQVSWQYRPAANALFTNTPVTAQVFDLGTNTTVVPEEVTGKFVVATWNATAATRSQLLTDLATAGAAGVIFTNTAASQALSNPGNVPEAATGIQVVGASLYQGERIRELLTTGPLTLSMTTERSSTESSNTIGVRPAVGDTDGTAPILYIGAHIDSVVGSPGASDNASGVGIMLESARILSQYALDTEIRVGTWGAEEKGIVGSQVHAKSLTPEEIDRTIGAWNMDMAGTAHLGTPEKPFGFWGLSLKKDGMSNDVLNHADALSGHTDRGPLNRGFVGRSDHQSFQDVGIDAAVFSWMFWSETDSIVLEPTYHMSNDTIDYVSQERMGISAEIIGGSAFRAALNTLTVTVEDEAGKPAAGVPVAMSCGADEGWREVGATADDGTVSALAPTTECDFAALGANGAIGGALGQQIATDAEVEIALIKDTTTPTVTFEAPQGANEAGWYRTAPITVGIAADDETDEAPLVEFSRNGTDWAAYTGPIELADEGVNTLFARATDGAGNTTLLPADGPQEFRLDSVAPTLAATANPAARGDVTVEAADATSGVADVEYRVLPDGAWASLQSEPAGAGAARSAAAAAPVTGEAFTATIPLGAEAATVEVRATDTAGNASAAATLSFAADATVKPEPKPEPQPDGKTPPVGGKPAPGKELAHTGGPSLLAYGAFAGALLLLSGGALVIARRRSLHSEVSDS
ncbi:Aminopeptidase Y (Arg, Lys, Leu preference) [Leucobacter sp. 7(1)]|uniref:M28 family peptidase n=1 Tax=Leucobacter sp. 7(1) TaxID=1255613 RepID=UPI00097ECB0A|nr:M28 family peptidase [Leucobacter sp. 7(1)]SJN09192.1 Aminopeptidase Y (Arg, Lys, Leu preference) [Leucobacter sp. 7(1)]